MPPTAAELRDLAAELGALQERVLQMAEELEAAPAAVRPPAKTWAGVMTPADFFRLHGERLGLPVGRAARRAIEAAGAPAAPAERPRYAEPAEPAARDLAPRAAQTPLFPGRR